MADKNLSDLGAQINDTLQEAMKSGNFSELKKTINFTAADSPTRPPIVTRTKVSKKQRGSVIPANILRILGYVLGIPLVLGWFISGIFSLVAGELSVFLAICAVFFPLTLLAIWMVGKGNVMRNRITRLRLYARQWGDTKFCEIAALATRVGKSPAFVIKDLRKMIHIGMLPEAVLDETETTLILDHETYEHYLETQENLKKRQEQEKKIAADPDGYEAIVEEGRRYVREIEAANTALPGEEISNKLFSLQELGTKIFNRIEQRPEKIPEMRRLMNYYLPTTLKLVNAYRDFETQPVQGDSVRTAKQEILDILDTINEAFSKLLDSLFKDDVMDISTDISALKTILAQDGLTQKDDFR